MLRFDFDLMHWNRFYFQLELEATFSGCCVRGRGLWQLKFGFYFSIAFTLSSSLFLSLLLGKRCFLRLLLRQKGRGASPYGGCCWKSRSEGSWRATAFEEGESSQSGPVPPTDNTHTPWSGFTKVTVLSRCRGWKIFSTRSQNWPQAAALPICRQDQESIWTFQLQEIKVAKVDEMKPDWETVPWRTFLGSKSEIFEDWKRRLRGMRRQGKVDIWGKCCLAFPPGWSVLRQKAKILPI